MNGAPACTLIRHGAKQRRAEGSREVHDQASGLNAGCDRPRYLFDRPVIAEQVSRALVGQKITAVGQRTPPGVSGPPEGQRTTPGGQRTTSQIIRDAAEASAATDIDPSSDIHASSRYRRRLAAVLIRRVLERAFHSLESA